MSSPSRTRRWWTEEEDRVLRHEAHYQLSQGALRDWNRIAAKLPGRTNKDCRKRWSKICDNIKKGAWNAAEDEQLRAAVGEFGFRWTHVAQRLGTRQADQCAKRWYHSLDPSLDRREWSADDDALLLAAVETFGRKWKTIRENTFPNRSSMDIKNRHVILDRRRQHATRLLTPPDSSPSTTGMTDADEIDTDLSYESPSGRMFCHPTELNDMNYCLDSLSRCETPLVHTPSSAHTTLPDINGPSLTGLSYYPDMLDPRFLQHSAPLPVMYKGNYLAGEIPSFAHMPSYGSNVPLDSTVMDMDNASKLNQQSTLILEGVYPDAVNVVMKALLDSDVNVKMRLLSQ
ncbi:MAG: hypothetical protein M1814_006566 [Vezdaea aestivalis]|nr:MAG: hypothetical protein M1814_006566 [Vezdaea aestivalis]